MRPHNLEWIAIFLSAGACAGQPSDPPIAGTTRPALASTATSAPSLEIGEEAHLFRMSVANAELAQRQFVDLREHVGREPSDPRAVVLVFGAWHCDPCKKELAELARQNERVAQSNALFIVVLIDDDSNQMSLMKDYVSNDLSLKLPLVLDEFQILARKYRVSSLPRTVILAPDGRVRAVRSGYDGPRSIEELLSLLLGS